MIKNSDTRYGSIAITFHWVMAILVIVMLCLGIYMADLPISGEKLKLYGWHKELGITILGLVCLRLGWRMANITPSLPVTIPLWQKAAAHFVHYALYFFMIFMPLTGWLMSSAAGLSVSFFGLFVMPDLISPNKNLQHFFHDAHVYLAYCLIATICLHIGAALKHHFINRDDVLRRMLP